MTKIAIAVTLTLEFRGGRMRANGIFVGLAVLFAASTMEVVTGQSSPPNSPSAPSTPRQQAQNPGPALQVRTPLVTVDVVATDSHGNLVRDLKSSEVEVADGGPQRITQFSLVDKSGTSKPPNLASEVHPRPNGFYTNQDGLAKLTAPPTVILLDALNTAGPEFLQTRRNMLRLLQTIPPDTPVAVFLLEQSVVVVQDFTSDPAILRAALDRALRTGKNGNKAATSGPNGAPEESAAAKATQSLEEFEKASHLLTADIRVATTLDTFTALAR